MMFEDILKLFFVTYFFAYNSLNLVLILVSFYEVKFGFLNKLMHQFDGSVVSQHYPGVSILVPAYNEEKDIIESLHSLFRLNYPHLEIIVINDGSTDGTFRRIKRHFGFERAEIEPEGSLKTAQVLSVSELKRDVPPNIHRLLLIDKKNGGKADALNVGINFTTQPYVCSMDADSIMEHNAIIQIMRMLALKKTTVLSIGGQVGIVNGCELKEGQIVKYGLPRKWITLFQFTEYIRSFVAGRTAHAKVNALLVLSGVFSIIEKEILRNIGGYLTKYMDPEIAKKYVGYPRGTVCEDMEVIVRIHRYMQEEKVAGEIAFYPNPIAWTEAPERWADLGKQRDRWYRGLAESLWIHKKMFLNPRYGRIGLFAMPYQILFEFLGPLIEFFGYLSLPLIMYFGSEATLYLAWFMTASILYGSFISFLSVILGIWVEEDAAEVGEAHSLLAGNQFRSVVKVVLFAIGTNFFYRQYIVFWQIRGFIGFLRKKESWEKLERKGLG